MRKTRFIFFLFLYILPAITCGQSISRYNTFNYGVNEGLMQTTIRDIEIDQNNFCWIAFPNGVQRFDGHSFTNIPVQEGLPDDKLVSFLRCEHGDLFVAHAKGISKYIIGKDKFLPVYELPTAVTRPINLIGCDENIFYFFDESGTITGINCTDHKVRSVFKTDIADAHIKEGNTFLFSNNVIDHRAALKIDSLLYLLDLREKKILYKVVIKPIFNSYLLRLRSGSEALYYDPAFTTGLQCWDFKTNTNTSITIPGKDNNAFGRCNVFPWRNKVLLSFANRLFETDTAFTTLKKEWVNFQNQPVSGEIAISQIRSDNFGNIYIQTVNAGIRKILQNNYPIKYFGTIEAKDNNILSIYPDKKNNRILVGGSGGLLIFDTLQHLVKQFRSAPGLDGGLRPNGIVPTGDGAYYIFNIGRGSVWRLNKDISTLTRINVITDLPPTQAYADYFGNLLSYTERSIIFQSQGKLFVIDRASQKIHLYQFSDAYIHGGLRYDDMIISHGNNELIFLDANDLRLLKKIPFPNTGGVRSMVMDKQKNLVLGTNKGIFRISIDGKIIQQWNKSTGLPDECIYAMVYDKKDRLWFSTNKGIFQLGPDNSLLQLTRQDGLQENEFNTNVVVQADDEEIFFGGINGVSSFFPSAIESHDEKIKVMLTMIRVNNVDVRSDSAAWNIDKLKLRYNQNALSFDFIAIANNNPSQYVYQYRMKGIDKEWIQNTDMQTVRYTLPPGKYTFQLYASHSFDKDAKPMKEIRIIIQPPFWKTWWFLTALGVAFIIFLTYGINQRNKRKYAKKLQQLENEKQIKLERERISKDLHDSIGAYANAVLYKTEQLEKERTEAKKNQLIGDLRFASKDIITSLRETVWALKKESYTAEDCLMRIRNFIQPFTRYYEHIHFKITGEAPQEMILHYTKALNLVRIVQEAVSNSIKHAQPSNLNISSSSTDDNKWKIVIADDGKGFDHHEARKAEQGNGLYNMEHRAADSGFEFTIQSGHEAGTTITIIV